LKAAVAERGIERGPRSHVWAYFVTACLYVDLMSSSVLVAGEHVEDLIEVLRSTRIRRRRNGMYHLWGEVPSAVWQPFSRALRRIEIEIQDANHGDSPQMLAMRTPEQLRVDAFVALTLRIQEAIEVYDPS
jgi:hypothetical protein